MSLLNKEWKILNKSKAPLRQKLLENRGLVDEKEIAEFLNPDITDFHEPYLFEDMEKAVKRIMKALRDKERIIVFGDYDVDGITGATILVKTLKSMGANVSYRLPHRLNDGYGLKEKFIKEFAEIDVKIVITVDCGISCFNEIELANKNGIDVIITDHHTVPKKKPNAYAIIHPLLSETYPCKDLTGSGTAFKLAQALVGNQAEDYIDLAAMGTVADIGLLKGENRLIVKKGLERLADTKSQGLMLLKRSAKVQDDKIDTGTIGYHLGPRINAAGRIDSPYFALQLLLSENQIIRGQKLAQKLEQLNGKRQDMLRKALFEMEVLMDDRKSIIIQEHKDWHVGILGLIAGRISEKYGIPAMILQDFGEHLVASARSPEHFNVIEALTVNSEFLNHFGGHARAAGFEIKKENYAKFKKAMEKYATKILGSKGTKAVLKIECELQGEEINSETIEFIRQLRPFGSGNDEPNFLIKGVDIIDLRRIGKDKSHLKIQAKHNGHKLDIIAFRFGEHMSRLRGHGKIDIVCNLEKNIFNGTETIQVKAIDTRKA